MCSSPIRSESAFGHVAIVGLGVMGGSLARALASAPNAPTIVGWSPDADEREAAHREGVISTAAPSVEAAMVDADLVVLATPLAATLALLATVVATASEEATVTDVASLKAPVESEVTRLGLGARWVGSHPMAGSERAGWAASRDDLYAGARIWTVAGAEADGARRRVHAMWRALGAEPLAIDADEHDRIMALASHLPQLASNALAEVLAGAGVKPSSLGPGGRDMTRLAGSNPDMWTDLLHFAPDELPEGLRTLAAQAERLAEALERGDVAAVAETMHRTRHWGEA